MLAFYRKFSLALLGLILMTTLINYLGVSASRLQVSLFPGQDKNYLWTRSAEPRIPDGKTSIKIKNEVGIIEYDFLLDPEKPFPYAHYSMYFIDANQGYKIVNLSRFDKISFKVLCDPKDVLLFVLFSFDEKVTDLGSLPSRRFSRTAFSCNDHWRTVDIAFSEINTPHWWLGDYGFELSDTGYALDKTMGFAWASSSQTPLNVQSHVRLTDVKMQGRDYRYIYLSGTISLVIWIIFMVWTFRKYLAALTLELAEKLSRDQQLIAYRKLSLEPLRDKTKVSLLRYIATEYANPELSLESTAEALGCNRSKINEILKEELDLTFTTYLNKLRLTEAARLLSENKDANISEIAYSVGYNNVSYFNKLFKTEYKCTPKTFKSLSQSKIKESID